MSASTNITYFFEQGVRVFPCRCGETHVEAYAEEDWNHHNCFHSSKLVWCDKKDGQLICMDCGEVFWVED